MKPVYKLKQNNSKFEIPLLKQISINQMINSNFAICQLQMATTTINGI